VIQTNSDTRRGRPARTTPDTRTPAERRTDAKARRRHKAVEAAAIFSTLPGEARIRQSTIEILTGWSSTTVWRRIRSLQFPAPKINGRITSWSADQVRTALAKDL